MNNKIIQLTVFYGILMASLVIASEEKELDDGPKSIVRTEYKSNSSLIRTSDDEEERKLPPRIRTTEDVQGVLDSHLRDFSSLGLSIFSIDQQLESLRSNRVFMTNHSRAIEALERTQESQRGIYAYFLGCKSKLETKLKLTDREVMVGSSLDERISDIPDDPEEMVSYMRDDLLSRLNGASALVRIEEDAVIRQHADLERNIENRKKKLNDRGISSQEREVLEREIMDLKRQLAEKDALLNLFQKEKESTERTVKIIRVVTESIIVIGQFVFEVLKATRGGCSVS